MNLKDFVTAETEIALKNGNINIAQDKIDELVALFCDNFIAGGIEDPAIIRTQIKNSINISVKINYLSE